MNRKQKIAIAVGAVAIALLELFPPWYFPATKLPEGHWVEARFDALRWRFSDRERDIGERLVARAMGRPISRPDLPTTQVLMLGALCLTMLAVFLLRTRPIFRKASVIVLKYRKPAS